MKNFNAIAICLTGLVVYQFSQNTVFNTTTKKRAFFLYICILYISLNQSFSAAMHFLNDRNCLMYYIIQNIYKKGVRLFYKILL